MTAEEEAALEAALAESDMKSQRLMEAEDEVLIKARQQELAAEKALKDAAEAKRKAEELAEERRRVLEEKVRVERERIKAAEEKAAAEDRERYGSNPESFLKS